MIDVITSLARPRAVELKPGTRVPWWGASAADRQRFITAGGLTPLLASYRGWTYKACTVIANRIAEISTKLVEIVPVPRAEDDEQAVWEHPFYDTLRRPNPYTTAFNFRKLTQLDLELTGNAYWLKVRDRTRTPRELWRIRPDRMNPILNKETGLLVGWAYLTGIGGTTRDPTFLAKDVVHFLYPSPVGDPYVGVGPLRAADYAFDIDEANKRYQRHFFEHGAQLSLVLSTDQDLDDDAVGRILDNFEAKHVGVDNSWLPIVLSGGLQATPMHAVNKELEAIGLMEFTRDDILSTFGVPKTKIGLGDLVNRASADALDVTFNRETINPRLRNIAETIENDVLSEYPDGDRLRMRFDNPVPEDRDFELRETVALHGSGLLRNDEARQRHQITAFDEDIEGGYGDQVAVPMGVSLIDPSAPPEEPPDPEDEPPAPADVLDEDEDEETPPAEDEDEDEEPDDEEERATRTQPEGLVAMPWHGSTKLQQRLGSAADERQRRWDNAFARAVMVVFKAQARRAVAMIAALGKEPGAEAIMQAVRAAVGSPRAVEELLTAVRLVTERIFRTEMRIAFEFTKAARRRVGRSARQFDEIDTVAEELAEFSWTAAAAQHLHVRENLIRGVSTSRFRQIMDVVTRGLAGDGIEGGSASIGRVLSSAFGFDGNRAVMIARTEVSGATNAAAIGGMRAGGANAKGWLAANDERVRVSHANVNGEVVPIANAFSNGLQHPGDPNGPPEEVINCRCTLTPEFLQ